MFEQKRVRHHGADAPRTQQSRHGDQQANRMRASRMERRLPSPPACARLHGAGSLRHTTNSPPIPDPIFVHSNEIAPLCGLDWKVQIWMVQSMKRIATYAVQPAA